MSKAVELYGERVLHHCASALFSHREHLSDAMLEVLLEALEDVKPSNHGSIKSVDVGLSQLVKMGKGQRVRVSGSDLPSQSRHAQLQAIR